MTHLKQEVNDKEKMIQQVLDKDAMTITGHLFKLGVDVENAGIVTAAVCVQIEIVYKEKECS